MCESVPVTLVVPVFQASSRLERLLCCLRALSPAADQVVLVDDGSQDDTFARLHRACGEDPRFLVLTQQNAGPAAARNRGVRAAHNGWVAFTDDDCLPAPNWLGELWAAVQADPQPVAVFGAITASGEKTYLSHYVENSGDGHQTANALYQKEALERVGVFHEGYRTPYLEDTDLFLSVEKLGPCVFASQALVEHPVRPSNIRSKVRRMSYYANDFLLYANHPQRYRERHRGAAPWFYLGYYVGLKHGVAMFLASLQLLPRHPRRFVQMVLTLLGERIYLAYLLLYWLFRPPYPGGSRNFAAT